MPIFFFFFSFEIILIEPIFFSSCFTSGSSDVVPDWILRGFPRWSPAQHLQGTTILKDTGSRLISLQFKLICFVAHQTLTLWLFCLGLLSCRGRITGAPCQLFSLFFFFFFFFFIYLTLTLGNVVCRWGWLQIRTNPLASASRTLRVQYVRLFFHF